MYTYAQIMHKSTDINNNEKDKEEAIVNTC